MRQRPGNRGPEGSFPTLGIRPERRTARHEPQGIRSSSWSKTKILADGADLPIWGFDGSSTNQAPGSNSDCVLKPVFSCPDPIRGGDNKLVMCEVLLTDMTPHPTNTRALLAPVAEKYA